MLLFLLKYIERTMNLRDIIADDGCTVIQQKDDVHFVQFSNLLKYDNVITHCFSTRLGGISTGEYCSLNLGLKKDDKRENVVENFKRLCTVINISEDNLVFSDQIHDNKIKPVNETDRGKGFKKTSDIFGFDGLITNSREVALVTFYADCVPVFLYDPVKTVIGLVHSGWKGTAGQIAKEAVFKMDQIYGCRAEDIIAAIGPSIGLCCFEVGSEVVSEFSHKIEWSSRYSIKKDNGKWNIDLKGIVKQTLINSGVDAENICISSVCTKCSRDMFFSYRGDKGKTGSLAAIMQIL
jgi:YfiH family protein